jgi:integrase
MLLMPAKNTTSPSRRCSHEGIVVRHSRRCREASGGRCSCTPAYQAQVWAGKERKTIRKSFPTLTAARAWRQESQVALRKGTLRAPSTVTLQQAADQWLEAAAAGVIRTRSGDKYKPSAIRAYKQALRHRVLPTLGPTRLTAISNTTLQDLADQLAANGLSPSSIRNTILPLRAIYRRAHNRGHVALNPTVKLTLPAVRGNRDRVAVPDEATALLSALPLCDRAIWATALYAGLRLGELQALDWAHIDLETNLIHLERSWDRTAGFIEPKSRSGRRRIPITNTLRTHLLNHRLQQGTGGQGLAFPNTRGDRPFNPSTINNRAKNACATTCLASAARPVAARPPTIAAPASAAR